MNYLKERYEYLNPNALYLVIDNCDKIFNNEDFLHNHRFKNLLGITKNAEIEDYLGLLFEVKICMDAEKVQELNNVSEIDYSDIESFVRNSFSILKRVDGSGITTDDKLFVLLGELVYFTFSEGEYIDKSLSDLVDRFIKKTKSFSFDLNVDNTRTLSTFSDAFSSKFIDFSNDASGIEKILRATITHFAGRYKIEEEWLVNSEYFLVPSGSEVHVFVDSIKYNEKENIQQILDDIEDKTKRFLRSYKVLFFGKK